MKKLFIILWVSLIISDVTAQVVPISSVRENDASGVPLLNGQSRTVRGVVTSNTQLGIASYIQDGLYGVVVYNSTFANGVQLGDSVEVTGTIVHFRGLTEFENTTHNVLSSGNTVEPQVITVAQMNNQNCQLEEYEGKLVRINGVSMTATGTFGGNQNYEITDPTGTGTIRISVSTNIPGTNIPTGSFDIIGVMGQYVSNAPYCGGYQLQPRSIADIVQSGGPIISVNPTESNITSTSVTISWQTQLPGDSKVKIFPTDSNYQPVVFTDSVYSSAQTTSHSVDLTGLTPGMIYYCMVFSTNGQGTSSSSPLYFATSSSSGSTGAIEVYFNRWVDTTIAMQNNNANGFVDFRQRLIQRIDSAQHSIDMAIYSFNDITAIKDRLIYAVIRGVKIRIVYDSRPNQQLINDLIAAGIKVQKRPDGSDGIMHDKFLIFDSKNNSSHADDWVWFGSANITNQQFYEDAQNVMLVQDQSLCKAFTREFEQMWGSASEYNNPSLAKFGENKSVVAPTNFVINGKKAELYFSPQQNLSTLMEEKIIDETDKSVNFAIFAFTRFNIANRMKNVYNPPDVMVRGVFDNANSTEAIYKEMKGIGGSYPWNPPARVWLAGVPGQLHHKYMVIDPDLPSSNPLVQTGSANFSNNAIHNNDEVTFIVYDSLIANQYFQELSARLIDGGGTINIKKETEEVPSDYTLEQNFPNPFNPFTTFRFSIPASVMVELSVFDVTGRKVSTLINSFLSAGTYSLNFDSGELSSGVYFYKLKAGDFVAVKKMALIK